MRTGVRGTARAGDSPVQEGETRNSLAKAQRRKDSQSEEVYGRTTGQFRGELRVWNRFVTEG